MLHADVSLQEWAVQSQGQPPVSFRKFRHYPYPHVGKNKSLATSNL